MSSPGKKGVAEAFELFIARHGEDAQVKHPGIAQDVPVDERRHIRLVGQPVTPSHTPSKMVARPPDSSGLTDEVPKELASQKKKSRY
jgi:hypothetical protein